MVKIDLTVLCLFCLMCASCRKASEPDSQTVSQQYFATGPKLVKIQTTDPTVADSLLNLGMEVIVVEDGYLVARLDGEQAGQVQARSLPMYPVEEEELVQRLVRIVTRAKSDMEQLATFGIDIWEVKDDTVLAQVYDKHIRLIREEGLPVEIIENNVQDMVKRSQK